jgi:septal ring factor EnvC (AmiA/AmiB activator)
VDPVMISDEQLDHLVDRLYKHQHGTGWMVRLATTRATAVAVAAMLALVTFVWTTNNRITATEINAQYANETTKEVKADVAAVKHELNDVKQTAEATHREVQDVKQEVKNLSSRLATTRPAPEPADKK